MIAVIDYGVGNLFSLTASLKYLGAETVVTNRSEDIEKADRIILPGVGAFEDAAAKLRATGQRASRCWGYVSACSCFLRKAMSTECTRV